MGDARSGTAGALAVLLLAAVFGGCGGGDNAAKELNKQEQLRRARKEGAREERIRQLEREIREQKKAGGETSAPSSPGQPASPSSGSTSCGGGLSVGPNTSCPFAEEVRAAYPGSSHSFEVYSPVTDKSYTMSCTTSSPHVCKGGNNASVYFP